MIIKIKVLIKAKPLELNELIIENTEKIDNLCFSVRKIDYNPFELTIISEKEIDCSLLCPHCEYLRELEYLYESGLDFEIISKDWSLETCQNAC